jgi:hypothetical protein
LLLGLGLGEEGRSSEKDQGDGENFFHGCFPIAEG